VTGGAGFIGSNLMDFLLSKGADVVCFDNFSTGKRENIAHLANHPNFQLIEGDIRDAALCCKLADGADYIFHEAALGSVPRSLSEPCPTVDVNISGFVNMLDAARRAGVKRFIYASSSSVYGDSAALPKIESETGRALSPYAVTKQADELFAGNFAEIYGMECIGLRYFNVFGRRQDADSAYAAVIPRFASALLRHESPLIYGDGTNSRDFTYIDDVIQANFNALSVPEANFVCNIAGGKRTTLNELFTLLRKELSCFDEAIARIEPEYMAPRPGDIAHSLADISLAGQKLGYIPEYSLAEGLHLTAKWYFENLK
jgi:UDP-N-acetylglucosamine 4-epimerase